jgi:hypothetical protein
MSTLRWLLGCCLGLALQATAHGLTISRAGDVLVLNGSIGAGDAEQFTRALSTHGALPVYLHSPGGRVGEALKMAEMIRARGLATHVPKGATCASACVLLLAGGIIRTADPSARIGIHMGSGLLNEGAVAALGKIHREHGAVGTAVVGAEFEQRAALWTLRQVNFFLASGISLGLLKAAAEVDHLDVRWLTGSEARSFNLLNAH